MAGPSSTTPAQVLNITGATTTISGSAELGGGIYNTGGTVSITGASITGTASTGGGILNTDGGMVTILGATFDACAADEAGAAICNENGSMLTATNSTFTGGSAEWGGEIANYSYGTMTLAGDTLTTGTATDGGGIFNYTGALLNITGTTISANTASFYGGGIYNFQGTVNFAGTDEDNNALDGGGVYNVGGTVTVNNSTITGNSATGIANPTYRDPGVIYISAYGAGIDNTSEGSSIEQSVLIVENSIISANIDLTGQTGGNAKGGGIYSNIGSVTVTNTTINDNVANSNNNFADGAGIYSLTDTVKISDSTISANTGTTGGTGPTTPTDIPFVYGFGGGVDSAGGDTIKMVNSTVAYNDIIDTSSNGNAQGGGFWDAGNVTITNSTIADNSALGAPFNLDTPDTEGGGFFITGSGNTTIYNTLVGDNAVQQGSGSGFAPQDFDGSLDRSLGSGQTASSFNLVSTRLSGNGFNIAGGLTNGVNGNIVGSDPNLGLLQDNGGDTDTMGLLFGSPAINAGDNALAVDLNGNPLTADQRGGTFVRIIDGTVDIGAFENQNPSGDGSPTDSGASSPGVSSSSSDSSSTSTDTSGTSGSSIIVPSLIYVGNVAAPTDVITPSPSNTGVPYSPQQIDAAYGVDLVSFGGTAGTGAGVTVAIVDAYDDADVVSDANVFSDAFDLPNFNVGGPTLQVYNEAGALGRRRRTLRRPAPSKWTGLRKRLWTSNGFTPSRRWRTSTSLKPRLKISAT